MSDYTCFTLISGCWMRFPKLTLSHFNVLWLVCIWVYFVFVIVIEALPRSFFFTYATVEPVGREVDWVDYFSIWEALYFESTLEINRPLTFTWNDILWCDYDWDDYKYWKVEQRVSEDVKQSRQDMYTTPPRKYGSPWPYKKAICYLESEISASVCIYNICSTKTQSLTWEEFRIE